MESKTSSSTNRSLIDRQPAVFVKFHDMIFVEMFRLMRGTEIKDSDDLIVWAYNRGQCIIDNNGLFDEFGISGDNDNDREFLKTYFAEKSLSHYAHSLDVRKWNEEAGNARLRATKVKFKLAGIMDDRYGTRDDRIHARTMIAAANLFFYYLTQAPNALFGDLTLTPLPEHMEEWRRNWHGRI